MVGYNYIFNVPDSHYFSFENISCVLVPFHNFHISNLKIICVQPTLLFAEKYFYLFTHLV